MVIDNPYLLTHLFYEGCHQELDLIWRLMLARAGQKYKDEYIALVV